LKPSKEDGDASDGDVVIEDDLPYGAAFQVNDNLVDMLVETEDARDLDWLPPKEQKRLEMRKKGEISCVSGNRIMQVLTLRSREEKGPFIWPRCGCEVGAITTAPRAHSCNDGSNETHPICLHKNGRLIPIIPLTLGLDIGLILTSLV
jgi:hypothetical protein